jgi:hypothetical protein
MFGKYNGFVSKARAFCKHVFSSINLYYARENAPHLGRKWCILPCVIQINTNLQISQGYIFCILQHFAAKLCNFTNSNMLFLAVVIDWNHPLTEKQPFFQALQIAQNTAFFTYGCSHFNHPL